MRHGGKRGRWLPWVSLGTGGCPPERGPWLRCPGWPRPGRWSPGKEPSGPRQGSRDRWALVATVVAWLPGQLGKGWHLLRVSTAEPTQSPEITDSTKIRVTQTLSTNSHKCII